MTQPKLSICIPTYNRAPYLEKALACLAEAQWPFAHEIVISDNSSSDNTAEVVERFIAQGLPIRYLRCPVNAGAGPNLTNAIRHASGDYMIYQGDDDLLILPRIAEVVAFLDANPDVSAAHAPWYLHDEVNRVDTRKFYEVAEDTKFAQGDFLSVFEFLFQGHVFPEIAIYRMDAVRSAFVPSHFCFWPFVFLAHFLDAGAVAFLKEPFYRSVTASTIAPERAQAGMDDVMSSWDLYRGGLEYFLHFGAVRGQLSMGEEARAIYAKMCQIFTALRMSVAVRLWVARHDYVRAYELYTRMVIAGQGEHPSLGDLRDRLPVMVGLQRLAYAVSAVPEITHLVLSDTQDVAHIAELLTNMGLRNGVEVVADGDAPDPATTAVLASSTERADEFIERGHPRGFVFLEQELLGNVVV
ncbi:MAG: glycosyl transferase [Sphingomonadales bacterium 32-64-17]|nr:MAG: glycosyl transferase [Sphingomonadales bacterium 32-64-17]